MGLFKSTLLNLALRFLEYKDGLRFALEELMVFLGMEKVQTGE